MAIEEVTYLDTRDNAKIALWKICNEDNESHRHIFLTHGTFSNRKICLGLARYLVKQGYTCWIMEWRNHGHSPDYHQPFNFETVALNDIEAALDYLVNLQKIPRLQCITHSGGGICLTMCLLRSQDYMANIDSIVMFSCQAFSACSSLMNKSRIWLSNWICKLLGFVPGIFIGLGPENETYFTMKQWFGWNLNNTFNGVDGYDYREKMSLVKIPIFSICAAGDTMIAPPAACKEYLSAFNNADNQLLICSLNNGFSSDYSHHAVMQSSAARKEIWPEAIKWLQARE